MSDNLRRYRAIHTALKQAYGIELKGNVAPDMLPPWRPSSVASWAATVCSCPTLRVKCPVVPSKKAVSNGITAG